MEWSERMNTAINYIEENLAGDMDINKASELACCSVTHFQRMFMVIIGYTPAEYIRKRRLTLAARELASGNTRVLDIAVKYGYDSPDSFTRAFRNVHGISPKAAREPGVKLSAFPRISFKIELKGDSDMDYSIIEKPAFQILGRSRKFSTANGENFVKIPEFWKEYMNTPEFQELCELTGGKTGKVTGGGCLGVCFANEDKGWEPFNYGIGIEKPDGKAEKDFEVIPVPAASWAVFDCKLKELQDIAKRIFSEWFPSTGYEHAEAPELEVYFPENYGTEEMLCQIWIPIVKKK
jgi:AraC family transcriptional regulator